MSNQILIVDDEIGIRELLSEILQDEGYQVKLAENAQEARTYRSQARPDLVLLDIWMPDTDGITLLKEWASSGQLTMPVVMMSGHGTIDTAVEATRIGAFDFLEKPIALQKLLSTVGRALQRAVAKPSHTLALASLGRSTVIAELRKRLDQIANSRAPVLLVGEPGCGAALCARFLRRPNTPWVAPETNAVLAESPLDLVARARDGMLFLNDVGELTRLEQKGLAMLLGKAEKYNARLVCATSRSLPELVAQGQYDAGLFEAIAGLTVRVPSLREHREDIPELASLMLSGAVEAGEAPLRQFSTAALNALRNYDWPGNLTQLETVVKSLALTALGEEIGSDEVSRVLTQPLTLPQAEGSPLPLNLPLREARDTFERAYFEHHMRIEGGNMTKVAEKAGLERTHLYRKLKQLGIRFGKKEQD